LIGIMCDLIILAVEAAKIAASSENCIALRRRRVELAGCNHWRARATGAKFTLKPVNTAPPLAELAVLEFLQWFHGTMHFI